MQGGSSTKPRNATQAFTSILRSALGLTVVDPACSRDASSRERRRRTQARQGRVAARTQARKGHRLHRRKGGKVTLKEQIQLDMEKGMTTRPRLLLSNVEADETDVAISGDRSEPISPGRRKKGAGRVVCVLAASAYNSRLVPL